METKNTHPAPIQVPAYSTKELHEWKLSILSSRTRQQFEAVRVLVARPDFGHVMIGWNPFTPPEESFCPKKGPLVLMWVDVDNNSRYIRIGTTGGILKEVSSKDLPK